MKSLELKLNGKSITTAGDPDAVLVSLSCTFSPHRGHAYYTLSAQSNPDQFGKFSYFEWVDECEDQFSALEMRVVDTDTPDSWNRDRSSTHRWNSVGDALPICAFCGKSESEATFLVSGPGAFICDRCAKIAYETMKSKGAYAGE